MKCSSAIRQLAYDNVPDALVEYLQIGRETSRLCLDRFYTSIKENFGAEYLQNPIITDVEKPYACDEQKHGFRKCQKALIVHISRGWLSKRI